MKKKNYVEYSRYTGAIRKIYKQILLSIYELQLSTIFFKEKKRITLLFGATLQWLRYFI